MCPYHPPVEKTKDMKKSYQNFQTPVMENGWTIPHEKDLFFLGIELLVNEIVKPFSNCT
jgi:hypothetical protein